MRSSRHKLCRKERSKTLNNVEVFEDFIKLLKETFPNIQIDKRVEMLLGMAINHAFLCMKGK
jgi:hypothetical protein